MKITKMLSLNKSILGLWKIDKEIKDKNMMNINK